MKPSALWMKPYNFVAQCKRNEMQKFSFEVFFPKSIFTPLKKAVRPQATVTQRNMAAFEWFFAIGWLTPTAESSTVMFKLLQTMQLKCFFLQAGFPCPIRDFHENNQDWWYSGCFDHEAAITKDVGSRLKPTKLSHPNILQWHPAITKTPL